MTDVLCYFSQDLKVYQPNLPLYAVLCYCMSQKLHVNLPLPDVRQQAPEPIGFQWVSTRLRIDLGLTKILDGLGLIYSLCFLVGVGLVSRFLDEDMGWMRFGFFFCH